MRKASELTSMERAQAKEMYDAGVATLGELAHHFGVSGQGFGVAIGAYQNGLYTKGDSRVTQNGHSHRQENTTIVPELTTDFFNWMANELIETRAELQRTSDMLHRYQSIKVSNELASVYQEYTRR